MAISVTCDECFTSFQVGDQHAGKVARCKDCGAKITIPTAGTSAARRSSRATSEDDDDGISLRSPAPKTKTQGGKKKSRKKKNSGSPVTVKRVGIGVALFVLAVMVKYGIRGANIAAQRFNERQAAKAQAETARAVEAPQSGETLQPQPAAVSFPSASQPAVDPQTLYSLSDAPFEIPPFDETFFLAKDLAGAKYYSLKAGIRHPSGASMMMGVYLPPGEHAVGSLPCVLVAPAGTSMIHGTPIDWDPVHPEVLPYVLAGYAAIHYSLDGWLPEGEPTVAEFSAACQQFSAAFGGVKNADAAFRFARTIKQVNPGQIMVAGHSSAGTVALLYAAHQPELAGCLAYAPCVNVERHVGSAVKDRAAAEKFFPGAFDFIKRTSPINHTSQYRCPVLVYHAPGDTVTPASESRTFCDRLKQAGTDVTFVEGRGSDHYETMISEGIPAGLKWVTARATVPASARTATTAIAESQAPVGTQLPGAQPPVMASTVRPGFNRPPGATGAATPPSAPVEPKPTGQPPAGTRAVTAETRLEPGQRIVVRSTGRSGVGEVIDSQSDNKVRVHFLALPDAFDKEVDRSEIFVSIPAAELEKSQIRTLRFPLFPNVFPAKIDKDGLEKELLALEGYLPGTMTVESKARQVVLKAVAGSEAIDDAKFALLRAGVFAQAPFIK